MELECMFEVTHQRVVPGAKCAVYVCAVLQCFVCTHTHPFNGPFSRTTRVGRYQKGKTNLDFTEARDSEWQWHQLGHMQVCTSLQTDNHASTSHTAVIITHTHTHTRLMALFPGLPR